ncbi:MAG: hypothetical protein LH467_15040, partial [Gemmatimonadaceae bacterium]|nr:hypothetical protein [Gemmatimonadaceae bacterium]
APPTQAPPTQAPPTQAPPTQAPPTQAPPTPSLPSQPVPLTGAPTEGLPAPSGIVAVGTPSRAHLTWNAGRGARSYSVRRWSALNADCCRNSASGLTAPAWDDSNFPLPGAYMFEVTTTYADGQTRSATISYTRPDPVNPAGFAATQSGEGSVTLSWQAVPGVSFYQVWGPGIASTGVSIPGTTHQVTGIAAGAHQWTIGSFYVPGPVSTAGTSFSKASLQVPSTVAAAPPVPSPAASPPASAPPSAASSTGRYRIVATGFRVLHETKDHALSLDGHGDEVYGAFAMFHFDRRTSKLLDQDLRKTRNIGETGASDPTRLKGGTWTTKGGFRAGDVFPAVADPAKRYGAQPTDVSFPFLVWDGTLTGGQDAVLLLPTMWEYDGNEGGYDKWFANEMSEVSRIWSDQAVQGAVAGTTLALMTPPGTVETSFGPHINVGAMDWSFRGLALGPLPALLNSSFDRPIGSGISGVSGTSGIVSGVVLPRRAVVITREIVEAALAKLAQSAAVGQAMLAPAAPGFPATWVPGVPAGTIAVPLFERGSADLQGQYVLYLQVERVP